MVRNTLVILNPERVVSLNRNQVVSLSGISTLKPLFHYQRAKMLYEKALELHSTGTAYKQMISGMMYLEDDFNDNAYHFGISLDRYLIVNGTIHIRIKECDTKIIELGYKSAYNPSSFFAQEKHL